MAMLVSWYRIPLLVHGSSPFFPPPLFTSLVQGHVNSGLSHICTKFSPPPYLGVVSLSFLSSPPSSSAETRDMDSEGTSGVGKVLEQSVVDLNNFENKKDKKKPSLQIPRLYLKSHEVP